MYSNSLTGDEASALGNETGQNVYDDSNCVFGTGSENKVVDCIGNSAFGAGSGNNVNASTRPTDLGLAGFPSTRL